ncbi:NAD-dependent epimerase/dehydratase family protein [Nocardia gipuzkoensis]
MDYSRLPELAVVTGAAGFIGSHLVEQLLLLGVAVRGLDNLSTGSTVNLDQVASRVGEAWERFELIRGDVRSPTDCASTVEGAQVVFHQAALNSVPRSLEAPVRVAENNVIGMVTLLDAAAKAGVERFIYASSSSIYGDVRDPIRLEERVGTPMSPYAASKQAAEAFGMCYQTMGVLQVTGLRYFNVFGTRQNAAGPYSAVIPRWIRAVLDGQPITIHGDGTQRRDFTHVSNIVHANLLAYFHPRAVGECFNVGAGASVSLLELLDLIVRAAGRCLGRPVDVAPVFTEPRAGDVHSASADLGKIERLLGYQPRTDVATGIFDAVLDASGQTLPHASARRNR